MKSIQILVILAAVFSIVLSSGAQPRGDATLPCPIYNAAGEVMPGSQGPYYHSQTGPWTPDPATDDITLTQIGSAVGPMYNTLTGGDSDNDGRFEIYMYIGTGGTFTYRGYENDGFNSYPQVFQNTAGLIPYAYGEVDEDNLPDVIGQWSSWVYVYESPAPGQYANTQVWQSPSIPNVTGFTDIADLDRDGHWEIIHSYNTFGSDNRLVIWENTGDNQFQQIYMQTVSSNNTGQKAIADFDGDGLMEMALSSGSGDVYVYESPADNTFRLNYQENMGTWNAYACVAANDMDGNGHPEFIAGGSDSNQGWVTKIYEATGNNTYTVRQTITINDNYFGVPGVCVGDFDGDGVDEFIIQTAQALHVFDWDSTAQSYIQVQNVPENFGPILHGLFAYESNNDDRDEVFWLGIDYSNNTIILESPPAGQPQLDVTFTPLQPPVIIPAQGGRFRFNLAVINHGPNQAPFQIWGRIKNPDGSYTVPTLGPVQINPPVNVGISRLRTQTVPGAWVSGTYSYLGYANWTFTYPALDSSAFSFTKSTLSAGGAFVGEAVCTGDPFPGEEAAEASPAAYSLCSVSPNPFNPTTTLSFDLPVAVRVRLNVYDVTGRQVAELINARCDAGHHDVTFDGSNLSSGIYLYAMLTGAHSTTGKLVLLK